MGEREEAADVGPTIVVSTGMRRVDVTGADRVRYLEDITTQRLDGVPAGHVRGALHLDQHGTPLAVFDVAVLGDRLALLVPDTEVERFVLDVLGTRTFLLDARFEPTTNEVVAVRGRDADAAVSAAGLTALPGRCRVAGDLLVVHREGGVDVAGPPGALEQAVAALVEAGAAQGSDDDLEAARIALGVPAWGREITAPHLPEEIGLLSTHVHLDKGCYPGQEAVARMWMLGRPRRRLAVVAVEGAGVQTGLEVGEGRRRLRVTSVSPHGDRALAFVPNDARLGDEYAEQAPYRFRVLRLIGDGTMPPGHDPGITRRRDRRS